jgi:FkbH-like protein
MFASDQTAQIPSPVSSKFDVPKFDPRHDGKRIATALTTHKDAVARALTASIAQWDKFADEIQQLSSEPGAFEHLQIDVFVDYLAQYFSTGDEAYRDLYIGEKLKQLYDARDSREQALARRQSITEADTAAYKKTLSPYLSNTDWTLLEATLAAFHRIVLGAEGETARVLLIGDCLYLDVVSFLTAPLFEDGITLEPVFITSKSAAETISQIEREASKRFDLVFYSPFTYEQSPEYAQFQRGSRAMASQSEMTEAVESTIEGATKVVDTLLARFNCPILLHNSANIRRHDGSTKQKLANTLTRKARHFTRDLANQKIAALIAERTAAGAEQLFLLDELSLFTDKNEDDLGKYYYGSQLQHPAVFGRTLAERYRELIVAHTWFGKKKIIVCDLDNTLWDGVIGEGEVIHYSERQQVLKKLKEKGVVLAITSKNDPKNVHWRGGILTAEDFVASEIHWEPKAASMKRIATKLNLKLEHFLFIDDREDERELMQMAHPAVKALDATDPRVWTLLEHLSRTLPAGTGADRTRFYLEREQREEFLSQEETNSNNAEIFARLNISVDIREAEKRDAKRVVELINRTNQFNMCGSRVTNTEVSAWMDSPTAGVYVADAADKFGDMGTVAIFIVLEEENALRIPVFVLSCRVFGYGIETAILNFVKRMAGPRHVIGNFKETASNGPCRETYPQYGFVWEESLWRYTGQEEPIDPEWLTIQTPALTTK